MTITQLRRMLPYIAKDACNIRVSEGFVTFTTKEAARPLWSPHEPNVFSVSLGRVERHIAATKEFEKKRAAKQ